jgi:small subunit ribosomal protein S6
MSDQWQVICAGDFRALLITEHWPPLILESAMNRTYELMFIVRPDMTEEDQDKLISTLETAVTSSGGQVKSMEKMGKRRLAYAVRRFHDGMYMLLTFEGSGGLVHELERRLRVSEPVIKFLSVRIDEEQKRLAKVKAIRDSKRKAPVTATVTQEAAGEAPAVTA